MAQYERPKVQFKPRNKAEARQWKRDRDQLRFERSWKRSSKYENPLTGKKKYTAPKAELYTSKDLQKAQSRGSGSRPYRKAPSFSGTIGGMVSIILLIGVISAVFIAYNNSSISDFSEKKYFSVENFLQNWSGEVVVDGDQLYIGKAEFSYIGMVPPTVYWRCNMNIEGVKVHSDNRLTTNQIIAGDPFYFTLGEATYETVQSHYEGYPLDTVFYLVIIEEADGNIGKIDLFKFPDITMLFQVWSNVKLINATDGSYSLVDAISETGRFLQSVGTFVPMFIDKILPWNYFVPVTNITTGTDPVVIPWLNEDGSYFAPDQVS